jgi:hypothetical protein
MNWRPPDREDRQVAWLWAVSAGSALALSPVWHAAAALLPACPWHALTGWPCPGCGTTRALTHLLHADPLGALRFNPLAAGAAAAFLAGGIAAPVWLFCGGQAPCLPTRVGPARAAFVALGVLANWAWLCASGV